MIYEDGIKRLGVAIVKGAIDDYRKELIKLRRLEDRGLVLRLQNRSQYERLRNRCIRELDLIEQFIETPLFCVLCNLDPDKLLNRLRKERINNECERISKPSATSE